MTNVQLKHGAIVLALAALVAAEPIRARQAPAAAAAQQPAWSHDQLLTNLGISAPDLALAQSGQPAASLLPSDVPNEVGAAGAIRITGDLRRLLAWFRDIEAFMKAAGAENVGAIHVPASAADFARLNLDDVHFADLRACRPDKCEIRMPSAFLPRFQNEVNWSAPDAPAKAADLARAMLLEYVRAYQQGGDQALARFHNQQQAAAAATQFQDMLRRSAKLWEMNYAFAYYLESFPKLRPEGTEDRFYWSRSTTGLKPVLTLHHVALQEFPDGRAVLADKQFYATRQIDAGLLVAMAAPSADRKRFDLAIGLRARADALEGISGAVLRRRIEREAIDGIRLYLNWIRDSMRL
jgi:hypothetical protein